MFISPSLLSVVGWSWWVCDHPVGRTGGTASPWRFQWRCRCGILFLRCRRRSGPLRSLSRSPYVEARGHWAAASLAWSRRRTAVCCATGPSSLALGSWGTGRDAWSRRWSVPRASSRCWLCSPPNSGGRCCSPPSRAHRARCRIAEGCRAGRTPSGPPGPYAGRLKSAATGGWSLGRESHQLIGKRVSLLGCECDVCFFSVDEDKVEVGLTFCAANPTPNWKWRRTLY